MKRDCIQVASSSSMLDRDGKQKPTWKYGDAGSFSSAEGEHIVDFSADKADKVTFDPTRQPCNLRGIPPGHSHGAADTTS